MLSYILTGVSNTAFSHLMEFTYTATLAVAGEEEAYDVWKAAEYLQMQEAIKALNNTKWDLHRVHFNLSLLFSVSGGQLLNLNNVFFFFVIVVVVFLCSVSWKRSLHFSQFKHCYL